MLFRRAVQSSQPPSPDPRFVCEFMPANTNSQLGDNVRIPILINAEEYRRISIRVEGSNCDYLRTNLYLLAESPAVRYQFFFMRVCSHLPACLGVGFGLHLPTPTCRLAGPWWDRYRVSYSTWAVAAILFTQCMQGGPEGDGGAGGGLGGGPGLGGAAVAPGWAAQGALGVGGAGGGQQDQELDQQLFLILTYILSYDKQVTNLIQYFFMLIEW